MMDVRRMTREKERQDIVNHTSTFQRHFFIEKI
jgi:hypothetical protein